MSNRLRVLRRMLGLVLAFAVPAAPGFAQTAPPAPERIKGVIVSFAPPLLTVKTAKDKTVEVALMPEAKIIADEKSAFAKIKPNDFVAASAQTGPDGRLHAQDVRIFPEPMRGLGEGQYAGDKPDRSSINATVQEAVSGAKGKPGTLRLTFHGSIAGPNGLCSGHASAPGKGNCTGQSEIDVGAKVPVLNWVLGDTAWLEPGKAVSLFAVTGSDGKLSTYGVVVEHGGVKPLP
jgi:hypothetical protein